MARVFNNKRGFLTLIEILAVLAIILFLAHLMLKNYFFKPAIDKKTQDVLSEQGINTSNYKSTITSTREKLDAIKQQRSQDLDALR